MSILEIDHVGYKWCPAYIAQYLVDVCDDRPVKKMKKSAKNYFNLSVRGQKTFTDTCPIFDRNPTDKQPPIFHRNLTDRWPILDRYSTDILPNISPTLYRYLTETLETNIPPTIYRYWTGTWPIYQQHLTDILPRRNWRHSVDTRSNTNRLLTDKILIDYRSIIVWLSTGYRTAFSRQLTEYRPNVNWYIPTMDNTHSHRGSLKSKSIQNFTQCNLIRRNKGKRTYLTVELTSRSTCHDAVNLWTEKECCLAVDFYSRLFLAH